MAPPPPAYISADSALSVTGKSITAHIKTSRGDIDVELFTSQTPLTVINFFKLASSGFYNNLSFHRVVPDFVIQGGDPNGDGSGGPGYTIPSEDRLPFERGTMGIATAGFDTGGSQFFICHSAQPHLRGNYTAFGKVVSGMQVVDAISAGDIILSIHFSIK
ncbi:MAG TPA: peptidylprolyl isomerase [Caldithrix abyssi]|uniref:Peptidyl-prolyl cis-trans isomerase n=1 Tax=Caldithrix abyssi TaxID=187145 RepID=A0A7V1LNF8_CALAY|nr:peptidylprolyl isomerase [Caldithrix abyssi]